MSRKLVLAPSLIATSASLATSQSFVFSNLSQQDNASYQIVMSAGGSTGTFYLDGSDDILSTTVTAPINWTQIMACGVAAGSADTILIDINQWPHTYARLRYVSTSAGASTCTILLTMKQIGG